MNLIFISSIIGSTLIIVVLAYYVYKIRKDKKAEDSALAKALKDATNKSAQLKITQAALAKAQHSTPSPAPRGITWTKLTNTTGGTHLSHTKCINSESTTDCEYTTETNAKKYCGTATDCTGYGEKDNKGKYYLFSGTTVPKPGSTYYKKTK